MLRTIVLSILIASLTILQLGCSPPEPGSPDWLVGTWDAGKSGPLDHAAVIEFFDDGTGRWTDHRNSGQLYVIEFRWSLTQSTQLVLTETKPNERKSREAVITKLTPNSFALAGRDGGSRGEILLTRSP